MACLAFAVLLMTGCAPSPTRWQLAIPEVREEGIVLELLQDQRGHVSSATYSVLRRTDDGCYWPLLLDAPAQVDDEGNVIAPLDPNVLEAVTDDDTMPLGAKCMTDEDGAITYTTDTLRLCTTSIYGPFGSKLFSAYDEVDLAVSFDEGGKPHATMRRKDPPYPLKAEVSEDEMSLYPRVSYIWGIPSGKTTGTDGSLLPASEWKKLGNSGWNSMSCCDTRLSFELKPISSLDYPCFVQIVVCDDEGVERASDLVQLDQGKKQQMQETSVECGRGLLTFELYDDRAVLQSYTGDDSVVEVPATVEGRAVTEIGERAFYANEYVGEVKLPKGIEAIDFEAFKGTKLTTFEVPMSLKRLDFDAFAQMYSLKRFEQKGENGVTSVQDGVLFSADGTTLVAYPSAKGNEYTVPENVEHIGCGAFYGSDIAKVKLPESLKSIEACAFAGCTSLSSVSFPEGLERIGSGAYSRPASNGPLASVKTIKLGKNVSYVGRGAFEGLALESIEVEKGNPWYRSVGGFLVSADGVAVEAPMALRGVAEVPEGVTGLASGVLQNLTEGAEDHPLMQVDVTLPKSLTSIAEDALPTNTFEVEEMSQVDPDTGWLVATRCAARLHVPKGSWAESYAQENGIVYDNDSEVPSRRAYEKTIEMPKFTLTFRVYEDHAALTSIEANRAGAIEVPSKVDDVPVTVVGESDRDNVRGVAKTLVLPKTVREVSSAFIGRMVGLRQIKMDTNEFLESHEGVLYSADGTTLVAVPNAYAEEIVVREGTRTIGDSALQGNELVSVELPEGLERIGEYAFSNCQNLKVVYLPNSMRILASCAFIGSGVESISLNDGLETIGSGALNTTALPAALSVPDSVTIVGRHAFGDLTEEEANVIEQPFMIGANVELIGDGAFSGACVKEFTVASDNKHFKAEGPFLLSEDGKTLFACASGVSGEVHVPDGVEYLESECFLQAFHVTDIYLPESVLRINGQAFDKTRIEDGLVTLHCPDGSESQSIAQANGWL